ncbi:hypothetical protein [Rhizobium sp. RU36D]|uniref:hypothetical protein n=1 Tax=Rhizobium sp. RU36D TaxID=1907415 RepID=UPI0009D7B3E3|nr:hypothetical protein [Rhizobium sp. RU36D]SMC46415.1 hypothetical protein SAMN05880593_101485 [Rhizobium sp. RU36D]
MTDLIFLRRLAASCSLAALVAATPILALPSARADSLSPMPVALVLAPPADAQQPPSAVSDAKPSGPDLVDLAALYYYASEGSTDRVQAETLRLQAKYPGFVTPGDLYEPADRHVVDETPLWNLYKLNDFAGIEAEIERMSAQNPGWVPTEDFATKLARAKQRQAMTEAFERKDWDGLLLAAKDIDAKQEPEIDLLWMMVDAARGLQRTDDLARIYQGILYRDAANAFAPGERLTTLEKAVEDFPADEVRAALAALNLPAEMSEKVEALKRNLLRRDVAAFNASTERTDPLPAATVDPLRRTADVTDMKLLGWYTLKIGRPAEAETWFRRAMDRQREAESIKGLFLSLKQDKREPEARDLVTANLATLADDSDFMLDALSAGFTQPGEAAIAPAVVEAYSTAIQRAQSPEHAEILGWYAYNGHQFEAASAWFGKSWEWKQQASSLKGLALSAMQLKDKATLENLRRDFAGQFPEAFADLKSVVPPKGNKGSGVAAPVSGVDAGYVADFRAKRYGDCIMGLRKQEARGRLTAGAQLIKGWCHLELSHLAEARTAFGAALDAGGKTSQDAAYGMALTLMRTRLTDEAEALLARYPLSAARDKEIRSEIYWQRARSAFDSKQYQQVLNALNLRLQLVQEPMDMSRMRGWAHYHLGHRAEARAIFTRLNMLVSDNANRQALAIINGN